MLNACAVRLNKKSQRRALAAKKTFQSTFARFVLFMMTSTNKRVCTIAMAVAFVALAKVHFSTVITVAAALTFHKRTTMCA